MSENLRTFTDENFEGEVLKAEEPVLVDFWATWCAPCKMIAPIIENVADEFKGKVKVGKVNVDENNGVSVKYGIKGIPTLLLFKSGEIKEQVVGVTTKEAITRMIEQHLG
jgi:thioredoxin 1